VAYDHHGPSKGFATCGVEAWGAVPKLNEAVLQHVFCLALVVEHLPKQSIEAWCQPVVKLLKRTRVSASSALEQFFVVKFWLAHGCFVRTKEQGRSYGVWMLAIVSGNEVRCPCQSFCDHTSFCDAESVVDSKKFLVD
jgi:hypothetical protein